VSACRRMGVWPNRRVGEWRGAALDPARESRRYLSLRCKTGNCVKQAAPANVSTRIRLTAPQADEDL
jgi:hypothetical protein